MCNMLFKWYRQPALIGISCLTGSLSLLFDIRIILLISFEANKYSQSVS